MYSEKVLGNLGEERFKNCKMDYADVDWFDAFKKIHKLITHSGKEIRMHFDNDILTRGLNQDEVVYQEGDAVVAVNIPPCEVSVADIVAHADKSLAKACYEIGNKHAALFWGNNDHQLITPYNEPIFVMLKKIHGINAHKEMYRLNFNRSISSTINNHTH